MPYRIDNIDPRTTVMIVVDMQNDFVAEGAKLQSAQAHAMVPKLAATLRFCRGKGIRVVYTAHVHRRDGCLIRSSHHVSAASSRSAKAMSLRV